MSAKSIESLVLLDSGSELAGLIDEALVRRLTYITGIKVPLFESSLPIVGLGENPIGNGGVVLLTLTCQGFNFGVFPFIVTRMHTQTKCLLGSPFMMKNNI